MNDRDEIVAGILELAKLGLTIWLMSQRLQGADDEDIKAEFDVQYAKFVARDPNKLPEL